MLVSLASATSLGLTLTELTSNSYEHAFPGRGGMISVSVKRGDPADHGVATVADDGLGYVPKPETRRHGVGLVRRLMQQVGGTLDVAQDTGTTWTLRFPAVETAQTAAVSV